MGVNFALLVSLQHSPRKEAVLWYQMVSYTLLTLKEIKKTMGIDSQASDWCNSALHPGKLRVVHCPDR